MGNGLQTAFSALGVGYRQSVLNDFSIVSKAKFYIIDTIEEPTTGLKVKACTKILPVQINPHNISRNSRRKMFHENTIGTGISDAIRKGTSVKFDDDDSDTLDLELIYDIYDEYVTTTSNGLATTITGLVSPDNFLGMSLKNKKTTSLEELIRCASCDEGYSDATCCVLFKWGSLEFYGKITSLSCRYDVFSRWGEPLKANVSVTITQEYIDGKIATLDSLGKAAKGTIKIYERAEKTFNVLAAGLSSALR